MEFWKRKRFIVVNFWVHQFLEQDGKIIWRKNLKDFTYTGNGTQQARGRRLEAALYRAYRENLEVRVIICDGDRRRDGSKSKVIARGLDPEIWRVASFDTTTKVCEVIRGVLPAGAIDTSNEELEAAQSGFDGRELVRWFVRHRQREWKLREAKIESVLARSGGTLCCEVSGCGFDFEKTYGNLGRGYAHVHHKEPISTYPSHGKPTALIDLAIVCANCHSMIHRGGACRKLDEITTAYTSLQSD